MRHSWRVPLAIFAALTLVWVWPLITEFGSAVPSDLGDPILNTWILWWNAHAVPFSARWWNAPIFFPAPGAFGFSETLLGVAVLTTPLQWLGATPVVAYNVAFVLSWPAAALAAYLCAYRLTRRQDAAILAGIVYGFNPYRLAQMPHLQVLWSCWMPLALYAAHWYLEERRPRALVLLGACWLMNALSNGYYLLFFPVLFALWMIWFVRRWRDAAIIGATIAAASLPLLPLLHGYQNIHALYGFVRTPDEIDGYSADLGAFWATTPRAWISHLWTLRPRGEGELYPGLFVLLLIAAGTWRAFAAWRSGVTPWRMNRVFMWLAGAAAVLWLVTWLIGGWHFSIFGWPIRATQPHRMFNIVIALVALAAVSHWIGAIQRRASALAFYGAAAIVMAILAMGPDARAFGAVFWHHAPYSLLMHLPGITGLRVPTRFTMLTMLCLSVAAALAFVRLTRSGPRVRLAAALGLVIALEGWMPVLAVPRVPPALAVPAIDAGAAVLELPIEGWHSEVIAMLDATRHGHPLVNGYSGYEPPHYAAVQAGLRAFDAGVFEALTTSGPLWVFVDAARDRDGRAARFVAAAPGAESMMSTPAGRWFRLPASGAAPPAALAEPLAIAGVTASPGRDIARDMLDGDLATRWSTEGPQKPGDSVRIDFGRPVTVTRIELSLGRWTDDFPRALEVSTSDGTDARVVWSGSGVGPMIAGSIASPKRAAAVVTLRTSVPARYLILTDRGSDPLMYWSIAELRVFGR